MIGNPGAGKSTMLNSILKKAYFKSGYSRGTGLTFKFDIKTVAGVNYFDTPGLSDIEKRKEAAEAITESLKQEGLYKVYFVCTLEAGRLRPDDVTLLKLILESSQDLTSYYVIVNRVSKAAKKQLDNSAVWDILLRGGIASDKLPKDVLVLDRCDDIEDEADRFLTNPEPLIQFVNNSTGIRIHASKVKQLQIDDFDRMRNELEAQIQEIQKKNMDYQEQIKKLILEREQERQEEMRVRQLEQLQREDDRKQILQLKQEREEEKKIREQEKRQREEDRSQILKLKLEREKEQKLRDQERQERLDDQKRIDNLQRQIHSLVKVGKFLKRSFFRDSE